MVACPAARARARPAAGSSGRAGGGCRPSRGLGRPSAVAPAQPFDRLDVCRAVGSGLLWTKCCQTVDRHFQAREWMILEGEPGTGKATLARATHQARTPAGHFRMLDAVDYGPQWIADVLEELETGSGTLVLAHVDRLSPDGRRALVDALEPHRESTDPERPWVAATIAPGGLSDTELGDALLECFPRTVEVPPLRHHVEDVAELVPHLIARLTRGSELSCSPEAMRVLMRNRWPGNVEQLYQVLRKTVARRRAGVLTPGDLPPETRAITRRVLTPLEAIECDAIVEALLDNHGNKARRPGTWAFPGDHLPQDPRIRDLHPGVGDGTGRLSPAGTHVGTSRRRPDIVPAVSVRGAVRLRGTHSVKAGSAGVGGGPAPHLGLGPRVVRAVRAVEQH